MADRVSKRYWRAVAASVQGTSHVKHGLPCQDTFVCEVLTDRCGGEVLCLVASDGAGSVSRSEAGSRLVCSSFRDSVAAFLNSGGSVGEIGRGHAEAWLRQVQSQIAKLAADSAVASKEFACTVLAAVIDERSIMTLQIGDGAIVIGENGSWNWVFWPQRGEFANTTYFVTDELAASQMAFSNIAETEFDEIAIFTDGVEPLVLEYASKTVYAKFFESMMPAVRQETAGVHPALSEKLAYYLGSDVICDKTDDDKTLILASRRQVAADAVA